MESLLKVKNFLYGSIEMFNCIVHSLNLLRENVNMNYAKYKCIRYFQFVNFNNQHINLYLTLKYISLLKLYYVS